MTQQNLETLPRGPPTESQGALALASSTVSTSQLSSTSQIPVLLAGSGSVGPVINTYGQGATTISAPINITIQAPPPPPPPPQSHPNQHTVLSGEWEGF
ncbi:hypothetical protein N7488_010451 [Penicillium malachiteum]|nr:hypothetical protein N7488_010451 [Penicillium malachiteum]